MNILQRPQPERRIPKELATISNLSGFINENNIKLFSREDYKKSDILNYHVEQSNGDDAFFIVDLGEILEQYKNWKTFLPRAEPFYAVRANSDPIVLRTLAVLGCGFSCVSKNEIVRVNELEIAANRILYGNPVKDSQYIRFARSQNLDTLTFDNENELFKIKLYHPEAKLLIRINASGSASGYNINSKFGCLVSEAKTLLEKARFLELNVVGVSFNVGAKNNDPHNFATAMNQAREVFTIAQDMGMHLTMLDIGGGFPAGNQQASAKFEEIAKVINEALDRNFGNIEDLRVIAEPGRYFCTKSHTLMFNVIGKRKVVEDDGETKFQYYMNDGIYGSFNCIVFDGADPNIRPFNNNEHGKKHISTLFGPSCDDMDVITRSIELPELGVGEWCYVEDFGAYTSYIRSEYNHFEPRECSYIFMY